MKSLILSVLAVCLFSINPQAQAQEGSSPLKRTLPFPNVGVVEIEHPEHFSRVVAISDVHGMYHNLVHLLFATGLIDSQGQWQGGRSLLIIDGDSIDKGPDSVMVIDLWISLARQARLAGGAVVHLLGNHEAEFLANPEGPKHQVFLSELQRRNIPLQQFLDTNFPRGAFLRSMPLAARVGSWLFCHSGFFPKMAWPNFAAQARQLLQLGAYDNSFLAGPTSILEAKDWWKDQSVRLGLENVLYTNQIYGVVFGHQHSALGGPANEIAAADGLRLIKIDTGMEPELGNPGELLVFMHPEQMVNMAPPEVMAFTATGILRPLISKN